MALLLARIQALKTVARPELRNNIMLADPALAQTTYYLANPFAPWLWPLLALLGLALQLCALLCGKRLLLPAGLALVLFATIPERDPSLLVGDLLLCVGLWYWLGK